MPRDNAPDGLATEQREGAMLGKSATEPLQRSFDAHGLSLPPFVVPGTSDYHVGQLESAVGWLSKMARHDVVVSGGNIIAGGLSNRSAHLHAGAECQAERRGSRVPLYTHEPSAETSMGIWSHLATGRT